MLYSGVLCCSTHLHHLYLTVIPQEYGRSIEYICHPGILGGTDFPAQGLHMSLGFFADLTFFHYRTRTL